MHFLLLFIYLQHWKSTCSTHHVFDWIHYLGWRSVISQRKHLHSPGTSLSSPESKENYCEKLHKSQYTHQHVCTRRHIKKSRCSNTIGELKRKEMSHQLSLHSIKLNIKEDLCKFFLVLFYVQLVLHVRPRLYCLFVCLHTGYTKRQQ